MGGLQVEKRETGKTITIKINGNRQFYDDAKNNQNQKLEYLIEPKKVERDHKQPQQLEPQQNPILESKQEAIKNSIPEPIQNPNQNQKQEPFPIIKISGQEGNFSSTEAAATKEPREDEDSFDWILPEPEGTEKKDAIADFNNKMSSSSKSKFKKSTPKSFPFGKSKKRGFFTAIFTAVFLAVLLGTSLGLTILKLVIVDKNPSQEVSLMTPDNNLVENQKQNSSQGKSGTLSLVLPSITTFVVQGGVFTTKEAGKQIETEVKQKGVPAIIVDNKGQSVLLLSVTDTIEHARDLNDKYKQSGVEESFPKELTLGGKQIAGLNQQEKAYLEAIPLLFETLTKATSTSTFTEAIPQTLIESINRQLKKMNDSSESALANEKIVALKKNVDQAVKIVIALGKSATPKEITAVQQQLLALLASYQALG